MNPYYNLLPEQKMTQRLVDQFNADERLWRKLEPGRRLRRRFLRGLSSGNEGFESGSKEESGKFPGDFLFQLSTEEAVGSPGTELEFAL